MIKPPPNVLNLPLEVRAEMALQAAVERALEENARLGVPTYVLHEGRIIEISPEELLSDPKPSLT